MSETMWSLRGDVDQTNIVDLKDMNINRAWGTFSSNLNLRWNHHSQGDLAIQGYDKSGERFRFSLKWDDKGSYDIHFIEDTPTQTVIDGHARVVFNGHVEYWVPIVITYNKRTRTVDIEGADFEFEDIPVTDLKNPEEEVPELVRDVALVDFSNAVNNIKLEETDGTDILGNDLLCDQSYKIGVKVSNLGEVAEDITFTGSINGVAFNHLPKNDLQPGVSSTKTKTVAFNLPAGQHTITVEAHIGQDDVPGNNVAQRTVNIICD